MQETLSAPLADEDDALDLAALIGSRICHDLNNPLGAIGNGLELMELAGHRGGPEMALIGQSVARAKARVQFLRVAFGAAGADSRIAGAELAGIVGDQFAGSRLTVHWPALREVARAEAKLALLLLMCVESAAPFGGEITVMCDGAGWRIEAAASRLRDLDGLWAGVTGAAPVDTALGAPLVQFALAPEAARRLGRPVSLDRPEGRLILRF